MRRGDDLGAAACLPHAVKDLQPVRGIRSTSGSPILKDFVPTFDSLPVERMRKAGAIFIGKTNVPEFRPWFRIPYNPVYGATHNAYDQTRSAGGNAGGGAGVTRRAHAASGRWHRLWAEVFAQPRWLEQCLRLPHQLWRGAVGGRGGVAAVDERRRPHGAQCP